MALESYRQKRKFNKTPEPTGGESHTGELRFVVQKHDASHLHYDFRLEIRGVLKSWAVPKGPSMNPEEHRLAQQVEDHPFDYKDFEGIIPENNYGAGTVIIWDEGTFEPAEPVEGGKEAIERHLMHQLHLYKLRLRLKGKKLKGEFMLTGVKERGPQAWLLTKVDDKYATKADVLKKDKSVVSGLTIAQMATNPKAKEWISNRQKESAAGPEEEDTETLLNEAPESDYPAKIEPMLCKLIDKPFTGEDWLFELKFDGYRILGHKHKRKVSLLTRKQQNYTNKYQPVADELDTINHEFIIDGEVVALNEQGRPDFDALQKNDGTFPLAYYVFDILWLDGKDLTRFTLTQRRDILESILPESKVIRYSKDFPDGLQLFEAVKEQGLEGIVAKRKESTYEAGQRSQSWLKLHTEKVQDFVIGAWTESESGRIFRSLICGNYVDGVFTYVGHITGGFKEKEMPEIFSKLKKLEIAKNPFSTKVITETKAHWVKPELVANVRFATWTKSGNIRKPATFIALRTDKDVKDVVPEEALTQREEEAVVNSEAFITTQQEVKSPKAKNSEDSNWAKIENQKITSQQVFNIDGYDVQLSNIEKELWRGVTKADLIMYYHSVASYLLPYLQHRPLSLLIKDESPMRPGFYIKDMEGHEPLYAHVFPVNRKHAKKGKRDVIEYLVCNNEATLLYLINLGCIDINPWCSRTINYLTPDFISIDLDPSDDDFKKVIRTAQAAKKVFDQNKLKAVIKTSGKTGMHLFIPCSGFNFPQARTIAEKICRDINSLVPDISTTEVSIAHRGDKLYIDPNQNDFADTLASVYSVRPNHHPTVSAPLEWAEINESLSPMNFTIKNMADRLEKKGDLFKDLFNKRWISANNRALKGYL